MDPIARAILILGGFLLLGVVADGLASRTPLPRVTLLLLLGVLAGPSALDLLPPEREEWFATAAAIALVMVGFLLGDEFRRERLRSSPGILWIATAQALVTALVVSAGLLLLGTPAELALPLAGIATATAPAATVSVVRELDAEGPTTRALLGVVALDDALALLLFAVLLAAVSGGAGNGAGLETFVATLYELGGAIGLGLGLGLAVAALSGRVRPGEPTLLEALGVVFTCAGLSMWLEVSYLLSALVAGAVVANLAKHHTRPFHAIENIEWPFLVVFFLLAGASLELGSLGRLGLIGTAFILLRFAGKILGAAIGGSLAKASSATRRWLGLALLPQAGVELGLALLAFDRLPNGDAILSVTILSVFVFEFVGPVLTKVALIRCGEVTPEHGQRPGD